MIVKKLSLSILIIFVLCLTAAVPLLANVDVDSEFDGTLVITFPDGDIELLETGDDVPKIPSNSVLEIFDGTFSVVTGNADSIAIACLDHSGSASGGASLNLSCGETSGKLSVIAGTVALTTPDGKIIQLAAGDQYILQLLGAPGQVAPPTAAGEGKKVARGIREGIADPPVDPRGLEGSPAT